MPVPRAASDSKSQRQGWRYRANIAIRAVTACLGTYAVAALLAAALARTLPMPRVEAVSLSTLLAFLLAPVVPIWAFLAAGPWRALAGVVALSLLLYGVFWVAGPPA
ncbi:ketohydroxyglutarate aldolase [Sphingomonas sp. HF-S4]|uniref:Ketohydroxyglutarate aldolase n=1 Tax=Sphingomonas agrestis TaxID=3080540 RepID=A0ABU3Y802_9SPHN|nr:ketohydroxyglutarate aldolase [Sphingomonas sp. HF-S4]MDV3457533.1 ketohydroxyglutarate aldolase [Sphingomonas sp. HF-S4]